MDNTLLDVIRTANREFRNFFEEISRTDISVMKSSSAPGRIEKIGRRLEQVGEILARTPRVSDLPSDGSREIAKYEENLKQLRTSLESIQYSLLVERSHLENVRANLRAASAWAASLKETA